jgi:hypothetical protein
MTTTSSGSGSPEQLVICTQGNEAWYMGGNSEVSDLLSMLPLEFLNKIKCNNNNQALAQRQKKNTAMRASAKFIVHANVSIFDDLIKFSKDGFWTDIFIKIKRGINRKGFKFIPAAGDDEEFAGKLLYKVKTRKMKEIYCNIPKNIPEAYDVVTNFMQQNGGIVSASDSERMIQTISPAVVAVMPASTAEEAALVVAPDTATAVSGDGDDSMSINSSVITRKVFLKCGSARMGMINKFTKKLKSVLKLTKPEESELRSLISLIITSSSLDEEDSKQFAKISNLAWDPVYRKFVIVPKFIAPSLFDNIDNVVLGINRDTISKYKDRTIFDDHCIEKIELSKITIKNTKDITKTTVNINNVFITNIIDIIESYLLFVKYIVNFSSEADAKRVFEVSRDLETESDDDIKKDVLNFILTPLAAISTIIIEGLDIDEGGSKIKTFGTAEKKKKIQQITHFIPSVVDAFTKAYPDFPNSPYDLTKTVLICRYKFDTTKINGVDDRYLSNLIEEIFDQPDINNLFTGTHGGVCKKAMTISCAKNSIVKIMRQIIKNYKDV